MIAVPMVNWKIEPEGANGYMLLREGKRIGLYFPSVEAAQERMRSYINAENRLKMGALGTPM